MAGPEVTLAQMRARIEDEIQRSDLSTQITNAIQEACEFYQQDPFFKSDKQDQTEFTVANQNIYPAPADCAEIRALYVTENATKYPLKQRTWDYINTEDSNTTSPVTGPPVEYANDLLATGWIVRLFPTPDNAYELQYNYVAIIPAPVLDTDQDFWTTNARAMIRAMSKFFLFTNVLGDDAAAARAKTVADMYYRKLKQGTGQRLMTGRVASYW